MIKYILDNKLLIIIIHLIFGYLATQAIFPKFYGIVIVVLPIFLIYASNNENEEAFTLASYLVGGEVFIRMTGGLILYETGKYGVILFLMLGILVGRFKQNFSPHYVFYILLLLLGIVFTQVPEGESLRTNIAFNLSGPVVLGVASFYFYKRPITKQQLYDALFFMLLPLFSMISYLYFRTPDLKEIVFNSEANFTTSGGFGPNQVATAIGMGMFVLTIFVLPKKRLTGYYFLDAIFLIYFSYRGLLTFSRGGIITAFISLILFSFFYVIYKRISFSVILKYLLIISFFLVSIWVYTSGITGGMLENRYTGRNKIGVKEDISSGRIKIFEVQFENFLDNPLGIGVGNGKYQRRKEINMVTGASHNEVGRLLEEHGFIGFFLLILLLVMPIFNFFRSDFYGKAFIAGFYVIWFLTINHSAMRIALPGFVYALTLIRIYDDEE
ncbi:O-antigen ligase family protein [Polaribacter septentrionalilitoris]|uniref:O-antigen ligase family protein n=1 Tax=Polaribacter septentrionalilitoris TaxID=2494657 RepID=UPI00135B434E|nr:O-antigen ligase family protein [Polaribacter septentrionalilitoris]